MKFFLDLKILKHNRNFRLLFIGQTISFFGTMITSVAFPYQIYQLTHSTLMVGLLSLVQLIPLLFTALLGGVFADRYHRRKLLLISEFLLALACLVLVYNASLDTPHVWLLFIIAPIMSAVTGLHRPALDSIKQQIVAKEDFPAVGALVISISNVAMIAGPAVGGLIIAHFGLVITYLIDFATFLISLIALLLMQGIPKPKWMRDESTFSALKSGLRYAVSRQELMGSYLVDFTAMIFGMPNALFPAIAATQGGPQILGLLYAAPAVGALFFSVFSGWTNDVKRHGIAIAISAALWGVAIILFGFIISINLWTALFFLALAGGFDAISGVFRSVMWNQTIPQEYRGRLAGIEMISYLSGPKLGDTEAGLVAAAFGVTFSVVSGGILCIVGVAACCYFLPKFVKYRSVH
ncbi:MAG TPA: MFS transporter [Gammaproteobacteria bacterium]|nr:MFS transporter [Gammaproteobacteria bacterium]